MTQSEKIQILRNALEYVRPLFLIYYGAGTMAYQVLNDALTVTGTNDLPATGVENETL